MKTFTKFFAAVALLVSFASTTIAADSKKPIVTDLAPYL